MPDLPPSGLRVDAASAGIRADAFLCRELPFLSRTRVRQKIQTGESLLNGKRYASSTRLREGDLVTLQWRGVPDRSPQPELEILYEDEYLLAVNKPAGVASHPMGRAQSGTVIQSARQLYADSIQESLNHADGGFYPSLVNRLDTFTSGIVLIAKVRETLLALQDLAARALITKEYAVCVEGRLAQDEGRIDSSHRAGPLQRHTGEDGRAPGRPSFSHGIPGAAPHAGAHPAFRVPAKRPAAPDTGPPRRPWPPRVGRPALQGRGALPPLPEECGCSG